ncbi:hypothetical protein [Marixanthomonas spongiae]|uniref:Lipocalin-like domain-containing protein n=1 Tax=Marixanthomonas spongiae TaxID=2174845 RepID=A0A2U0HZF9_9FLAO|nr:hypothetical protein [Marixanthomonas spongiae]PVW14262.1 hypothetical protein DDV96_10675 [Marixanthomonas spongiae]
MKKLNVFLGLLIGFTILSCSSDDNKDEPPQNFFANAYLEIYSKDGFNCVGDLFLTSGTANLNSDGEIKINNDNENVVVFNEMDMTNCEMNNPTIKTFDLQNGYDSELNTIFAPDVFYDIVTDVNGNIQSANEYYANQLNITFAKLTFSSDSKLSYEIQYENGTILTESYSGKIEVFEVF